MRPTTPNYNFARQAGPSSPPPTPTATAFSSNNRRNGMHFIRSHLPDKSGTITPNGNGHKFFYTPSQRAEDLSPRSSSSPESSIHASSSSSGSPPRSLSSDAGNPISESPPRKQIKVVAEGNFIVEEFGESDYEDWDSDDDVIRPHQYEDAESEKALSVKSVSHSELDPRILHGIRNLACENDEDTREAWLEAFRAEKRRKRRSSSSVQKRTLSMSIGSDTDDEDIQPVTFDANDAGSSARRLRRKVKSERVSLIFDDPPPRIEEEDEGPESVEEVVEIKEDDDEEYDETKRLNRELPYYKYVQDMDVDTSDED
jgi:hypothetical protein